MSARVYHQGLRRTHQGQDVLAADGYFKRGESVILNILLEVLPLLRELFSKGIEEMRNIPYCIVVLLLFCACSRQAPLTEQEGEIYFPQASEGSRWEYVVKISTPSENMEGRLSLSIEGEESINGKIYNRQVSVTSGPKGTRAKIGFKRRDERGIYLVDMMNKAKQEYIITPFPLSVGKTWKVKKSDGTLKYKAEKVEDMEILGRTFKNCLKVTFSGDSVKGYTYFAPNIGEVLTVIKTVNGDLTMQYSLERYTLQQGKPQVTNEKSNVN